MTLFLYIWIVIIVAFWAGGIVMSRLELIARTAGGDDGV